MGRKHKHEEHVNHERWLVSYADMVTLLFALFVVLYAMSKIDPDKSKQVKESVQFALHIEGDGRTKEPGQFDTGGGEGTLPGAVPLINSQQGEMEEFLEKELGERFEHVTGSSLDIVMTDDTIAVGQRLSRFFEPGSTQLRGGVAEWVTALCEKTLDFTSEIRVVVSFPNVPLGRKPDGRTRMADELVAGRLIILQRLLSNAPKVRPDMVIAETRQMPESTRTRGDWENVATLRLAFSTNSGQ